MSKETRAAALTALETSIERDDQKTGMAAVLSLLEDGLSSLERIAIAQEKLAGIHHE